jgi:hypothetical protein
MTGCTLAMLTQLLGYTPQPGATIDVPQSYVDRLSRAEISHAKSCARRLGLHYRIVVR